MTRDTVVAMKQSDLDKIKELASSLGFWDQLKALDVVCVDLPYCLEGHLRSSDGRVVAPLREYPYRDVYERLGVWDFNVNPG